MRTTVVGGRRINIPARQLRDVTLYACLIALTGIWLAPIIWMLSSSLKPEYDIIGSTIQWIPKRITLENYRAVLFDVPLMQWFLNSVLVATCTLILVLVVDSLAAFAFARIDFYGRGFLFIVVLSTLMVPQQTTIVPLYLLFRKLGMLGGYPSLILPRAALALGVFLLRQFFIGIPKELEEAAVLDGCGLLRIYYHIVIPLSKPALSALGIFTFLGSWNDFLWPLVAIRDQMMYTLPVGLANFQGTYQFEYAKIMAAACIVSIPVLIVFFIFQRQFVKGIALTGIKG